MPDLKLVVEVCHASNLAPKDGEGTSSPFVTVEFDGQRHKTKVKAKDLNPVWNEKFEFRVGSKEVLEEECIEVCVFTLKHGSQKSLGKVKICACEVKKKGTDAADMVIPYALERRGLFTSVFSRGRGEIYLKMYYYEEGAAPAKKPEGDAKGDKPAEKKEAAATPAAGGGGGGGGGGDGGGKGGGGGGKADGKKAEKPPPVVVGFVGVHEPDCVNTFDVKTTNPNLNVERVAHDLVLPMRYLFVKVVKARGLAAKDLNGSSDPYVEVKVGNTKAKTDVKLKTLSPEWNLVFAFLAEANAAQTVDISCWDKDTVTTDDFLGYVSFDITEIPTRHPPDSPLAPQWYRLEARKDEKRAKGEIMLAVWFGTQADEAFPDAWQSDAGGIALNRSKVYISPRLWYLRIKLLQVQDLFPPGKEMKPPPTVIAFAELGMGQRHNRLAVWRSGSWIFPGEEILFVAAEPFALQLIIKVMHRVSKDKDELIGLVRLPLYNVPKRIDRKPVEAKWYDLEKEKKPENAPAADATKNGAPPPPPKDAPKFTSRIQLSASLDGGYHVLDETTHHTSDVQPTDRRLWKPAMGILELGILAAHMLLPTKTRDGRGTADTYCIAKYGKKWIRTRTVVGSLAPQWHEQYTWDVYDPCTVLTVAVFDNHFLNEAPKKAANEGKGGGAPPPPRDAIIGKLRIRLSTLRTDRTYTNSYPLISLERSGVKKKGELEIAVRFSCTSQFNLLHAYVNPLLPKLHYVEPLSMRQVEALRRVATDILTLHLHRAEPPIRAEVVRYMLDADAHVWSFRKSKATWRRILNVFSGLSSLSKWVYDVCHWKNKVTTVLVILLYMILVCFPEQILPTLFLYICLIGAWHWRYQPRQPPHMDIRLSQAMEVLEDELDEEFDTIPSCKPPEVIKCRYERLRGLAGRIQTVLTDFVAQLERFHALLSWRDPRATCIFILFCFVTAIILYVTPLRIIGVLFGLYIFRHPRFRNNLPAPPTNFFKRLPTLSDTII